jgi:REP element-mobilizing transposase RayT
MRGEDDWFNRRPTRLELRFSKLRPFYFVTFNTSGRSPILARPEVHETFRQFGFRALEDHDVAVGRYVLMPDHVHLFVVLPQEGITLSKWIGSLRNVLGKTLLRVGVQKPHWQQGFFDHLLRRSESYSEKWNYVRMNPVHAGLCKQADEWPYQGEIVRIFW